ncbi:MAG: DUF2141 domain-containing protein [Hyphococcus sp.]
MTRRLMLDGFVRLAAIIATVLIGAGAARADSAPAPDPFSQYADPNGVVAAVRTAFKASPGKPVRLSVYDSEDNFLEMPAMKHQGELDASGVALVRLLGLEPGAYAFAAYLDENGDGKLNRGALGIPKEPVAFSNGVVPKLRRPAFDETKVDVAPGSVVVITLED